MGQMYAGLGTLCMKCDEMQMVWYEWMKGNDCISWIFVNFALENQRRAPLRTDASLRFKMTYPILECEEALENQRRVQYSSKGLSCFCDSLLTQGFTGDPKHLIQLIN